MLIDFKEGFGYYDQMYRKEKDVKKCSKIIKKGIAVILAVIMTFTSLGITTAFADGDSYYTEDSQQLQQAILATEAALAEFSGASNDTTDENILFVIQNVVEAMENIAVAWGDGEGQAFTLIPATYTDAGSISGVLVLTYSNSSGFHETSEVMLNIVIPQLILQNSYRAVTINNSPPILSREETAANDEDTDKIIGQTGAGDYAAGAEITLIAGFRADFTFDGWEFSYDIELIEGYDANDATIRFIMPDEAVAATAIWNASDFTLPMPHSFGWTFSGASPVINANINSLPELVINVRLADPDADVISAAYQWFARIIGDDHSTGVPVTKPAPMNLTEAQSSAGFNATLRLVDEWGYIPRLPAAGNAATEYTSEVWQYFLEIVYVTEDDVSGTLTPVENAVRSVEDGNDILIALDVRFDGAGFVRNRPPRPIFPNIRDINTGNIGTHFDLEPYLNDPFAFFDSSLGTSGRVVTEADWWERNAEIRDLIGYYWFGWFPDLPIENIEVNTTELIVNPNTTTSTNINFTIRSNGRVATGTAGTITMPSQAQIDASPFNLTDGIPVVIGGGAMYHAQGIATFNANAIARTAVWPNNANITEFNHGSIMNSVWQSSRGLDALQILFERNGEGVDPYKSAVIGVSIGGKTAMLRGVLDERVALTVPVESGAFGMTHFRGLVEGYIPIYEGHTFAAPWMRAQKPMNSWGFTGEAGWFAFEAPPGFIHPFGARVAPEDSIYRIPFDMHMVAALAAPRGLLAFDNDGAGSGNGWMNPFGTQLVVDAAGEVYAFLGVPGNIGGRVRDNAHAVQGRDNPFVAATLAAMFGKGNNVGKGRDMGPVSSINVVSLGDTTPQSYGLGTYESIVDMGVTPFEVQSRFIQWARPGYHSIWTYTEVVTKGLPFTIEAHTTAPDGTQIQLAHLRYGDRNAFWIPSSIVSSPVIETWNATVTGGIAVFDIIGDVGRYQLSFAGSTPLRKPVYFSGIDAETALRSGASPGISHMYRSFGFTSRINMDEISVYISNSDGAEFYLPSSPQEEAVQVPAGWGGNAVQGAWGGWIMEYGVGIPNQNASGGTNNRLFNNGAVILRNVQLESMPGYTFEVSFASGASNGNPAHTGVLWPASEDVQFAQAFPFWPPTGGLSGSGGEGGAFGVNPDGTRSLRTAAQQPAFVDGISFSHSGEHFGSFSSGDSIRIEFGTEMFPRDFGIGFDFSDDFDIKWGAGGEYVDITFNSFTRNVLNGSSLNMYIIRLRAAGGATGGASIAAPIHNSFYVKDNQAFIYTSNGSPRPAGAASGGTTTTEITISFTDSYLTTLTLDNVTLYDPMGVTELTGIRAGARNQWILELNGQVHKLEGNVYISFSDDTDFRPFSERWHPVQIYRELLEGEFIPDPPRAYFPRNPFDLPISPTLQDPFEFFAPIDGISTLGTNGRVVSPADWEERREEIRDLMMYYYYGFMWDTPLSDVTVNTTARPAANASINVTVADEGTSGLGNSVTGNVATGVWLPSFEQLEANGFWDTGTNTGTGGPLLISMGAVSVTQRNELLARGIGVAVPAGVPGNENRTGLYFQLYPHNPEIYEFNSGSLMGNSWVVSRIIDAFELNPDWGVNPYAIATLGNSFQGKRALFAGVMDERVALTIPHESGGDGGVAPFRFSHAGRINFYNLDNFGAAANLFGRVHSRHETTFNGNAGRGGQGPADFFRQNVPYDQGLHRIPFDMHLVLALIAGENRAMLSLESDNFGSWTAWSPARTVAEAASEVWQFLGHDNLIYRQKGSTHAIHDTDFPVIMAVLDYLYGQPVHDGAYRGGRNADQVYVEDIFNAALPGIWDGLSYLSRSPISVESSWMPWSKPGTHAVWTTNEYVTEGFPAVITAHTDAVGSLELILWSHGDGNLLWGADSLNIPVEINRWTAPIIGGTATFALSAEDVKIGRYELTTGNVNDQSAFFHGIDVATALRSGPTQDNIAGPGGSMMLGFTSRVNDDLEVWVGEGDAVTQRTLSPYQSFNSDNWLMNYGVRLAPIPGTGANRWYSLRNVQFEALPGVTFEVNFQQSLNTGGWPNPDMAVSWQASEAVQNIGPYPHWRPGGNVAGNRPVAAPLPYMANRTTQFEAALTHSLDINAGLVEAWIIDFSEPMNPREIGIGFDFGGAFTLEWSNNNETLTVRFASPVSVSTGDIINMYIMRLRDARAATGNNAAMHNARTINQPIHHFFDLSELGGEDTYIWSLADDAQVQALAHGTTGGAVLATPYLMQAGSPVFTIVAHPSGGNSIQISNRTADWNALDLVRAPLGLVVGNLYTVEVIGRVPSPPVGTQVNISGPSSPWDWLASAAPNTADGTFSFTATLTHEQLNHPQFANAFRIQTNNTADFIVDEIIVRHAGTDTGWFPPTPPPAPSGDVLRVETVGITGSEGAQVPVSELGISAGREYEFTVDFFVPSATSVDIQLQLKTDGPSPVTILTTAVFRAHPGHHDPTFAGPQCRRYTGTLDLQSLSALNFDNIQIVALGPNTDRPIIFRADNFIVTDLADNTIVASFDFEAGYAPFVPIGDAFLETRPNVWTSDWHTIDFSPSNWAIYEKYIQAHNDAVMPGAHVTNQGRDDSYSFRLENTSGIFTNSQNKSLRFDLPVAIPIGAHVEVSWKVFVPSAGNEGVNPAIMVGPGLVVNRFVGSPELQPTNTIPAPGDLNRRIAWDEWVETNTSFEVTAFSEPVEMLYFRFRADAPTGNNQPHVVYIDDIRVTVTIADEPYIPTWDNKMAEPSLADTFSNYFLIGQVLEPPLLANTDLIEMFLYHYNSVTAENAMKPDSISGGAAQAIRPPSLNLSNAELMTNFANDPKNNLHMVGHTLTWHEQSALWLHGNAEIGWHTRAEAMENMRWFIEHYAGNFEGRIDAWDVVNEAVTGGGGDNTAVSYASVYTGTGNEPHPVPNAGSWQRRVRNNVPWFHAFSNGANFDEGERGWDYIYYAFAFARKYAPDALLIYNDFNEEIPGKRDAVAEMVEYFNNRWHNDAVNNPAYGNPSHPDYGRLLIEVVGMQAHYNSTTNIDNIRASIVRYAQTGVRIHVTELDIHYIPAMGGQGGWMTPAQLTDQANRFGTIFKWYLEFSNYIDRVTFWGRDDMSSWRSTGAPTLFNRHLNPKPAFFTVMEAADNHLAMPFIEAAIFRNGEVGTAYRSAVVAGGRPVPTLFVIGGQLPPGLTLSATGNISGIPTAEGMFEFTVEARAGDNAVTQDFSINIISSGLPPQETPFKIHPLEIVLNPDRTRGFIAIMLDDIETPAIKWSVTGHKSSATNISSGGFLRVGADEPFGTIIVRAELFDNPDVFATASVTVSDASIIDGLERGLNFSQYPSLREVHADYFLIGAAGDGNIGTGSFIDTAATPRGSLISHHFNTWTFENSMKVQSLRGSDAANRLQPHEQWPNGPTNTINAARHSYNNMAMIGHTLAWHSQSPAWMWDRHEGGNANRDIALENMRHHITGTITRWGSELQAMDVVNEAIGSVNPANPQDWRNALSRGEGWYPTLGHEWVEYAFIFSAEITDSLGLDMKLYYNDFLLHTTNKGIAAYEMIKDINARHAAGQLLHPITGEIFQRANGRLLIEGVGMQDRQSGVLDIEGFETAIRNFGSLGLYVSITELDLSWRITQPDGMLTHAEEIAQAQEYARLFEVLRKYAAGSATTGSPYPRAVERVTFWGIDDALSWAPGQPMLFNAPSGGRITGKEALLAVLDPQKYLEMHPWSPPPAVIIPGIHVFNLEADGFTGMNIILGNNATQWPWSTAGSDGQVAYRPQAGARYRMEVRYQSVGTFGLEAHWLSDNSFDNFTLANNMAADTMPTIIRGDTDGSFVQSIPARFSNPGVGGSYARMAVEFVMPAHAEPEGLVGNIALRGIDFGHEITFYSVTIHKIGEDGEDDVLLVNWPNVVPLPAIPGIIVHKRDVEGGRADIIIGSGRDVWPFADAHESGRAFDPEPGVSYRIMFNVTTTGAGGWRVRWIPCTGGEDYTTADGAIVNNYPMRVSSFGLGVPTPDMMPNIPFGSVIPSHPSQGVSTAGVYTIVQDITLDGGQPYQGLIGNIALRGTGGSGLFNVNWITIERLEGAPGSQSEELLVFWPYGVNQFDNFVNNFEMFAPDFPTNPLNVGTGANAVTASITRDAETAIVNQANPPRVGDVLVASITAGTATGTNLGTRAGTTGGVLKGNVTYAWIVGGIEVQRGSQSTFAVMPEHFGRGMQLEITSDWETGILTSAATPAVEGGFVLKPDHYHGTQGSYIGGTQDGIVTAVLHEGFAGTPVITVNESQLPDGVRSQVDGVNVTFAGMPKEYGVFMVTLTTSFGSLTTSIPFTFYIAAAPQATPSIYGAFNVINPHLNVRIGLRQGGAAGLEVSHLEVRDTTGNGIEFTFNEVNPGTYSLIFTRPGYTGFTINNIIVTDGGSVDLSEDTRFPNELPLKPGDVNGDGVVNLTDLDFLLLHWFGDYINADFNGDGQINIIDLDMLLANWLQTSIVVN